MPLANFSASAGTRTNGQKWDTTKLTIHWKTVSGAAFCMLAILFHSHENDILVLAYAFT
jgi:hypothetical protein